MLRGEKDDNIKGALADKGKKQRSIYSRDFKVILIAVVLFVYETTCLGSYLTDFLTYHSRVPFFTADVISPRISLLKGQTFQKAFIDDINPRHL